MIVVHVIVDCRDAMGANLVNSVAEARRRSPRRARGRPRRPAHPLEPLRQPLRARALPRPRRRARDGRHGRRGRHRRHRQRVALRRARSVPRRDAQQGHHERRRRRRDRDRQRLARRRGGRARVRGALGPVLAARDLARATGDALVGRLEMPLALGTVGGTLRVHPAARLSLRIARRRVGAASSPRSRRRSASRRTSRPSARSRPTASSAVTWRSTLAPSRSRPARRAARSNASRR